MTTLLAGHVICSQDAPEKVTCKNVMMYCVILLGISPSLISPSFQTAL